MDLATLPIHDRSTYYKHIGRSSACDLSQYTSPASLSALLLPCLLHGNPCIQGCHYIFSGSAGTAGRDLPILVLCLYYRINYLVIKLYYLYLLCCDLKINSAVTPCPTTRHDTLRCIRPRRCTGHTCATHTPMDIFIMNKIRGHMGSTTISQHLILSITDLWVKFKLMIDPSLLWHSSCVLVLYR